MTQKMVGLQSGAKTKLQALSERKRVSQQGILSALVMMAAGESNYGIIEIDWVKLRKDFPSVQKIQKRSWKAVLLSVQTLMEETMNPEEMAQRSRFTLAQCERAMKEILDEGKNTNPRKR